MQSAKDSLKSIPFTPWPVKLPYRPRRVIQRLTAVARLTAGRRKRSGRVCWPPAHACPTGARATGGGIPCQRCCVSPPRRCGAGRAVWTPSPSGAGGNPRRCAAQVGFTPATPGRGTARPAATTLHDACKRLEVVGVEAALHAWAVAALAPTDRPLVLDGKALRGIPGEALPGCPGYARSPSTRLRPAWCWRKRGVRTRAEQAQTEEERAQAQRAGSTRRLNRRRKTGGGKQAAELRVAPRWRRGGAAPRSARAPAVAWARGQRRRPRLPGGPVPPDPRSGR